MRMRWTVAGFLSLLILGAGLSPAGAGDSLYGKVTEVKSGKVVTLDYGAGQYVVRLIGIELAKDKRLGDRAAAMVRKMVLGKNARMRFEGLGEDGLMQARLYTDDPILGIREVAPALVRAGLATRQKGFDFKYGELSAAESEARSAHRGVWAVDQR